MFTNSSAVLYHYDSKDEKWSRTVFPCAYIFSSVKASVSPADFSQLSHTIFRIPNCLHTDISVGDYILAGKDKNSEPDTSVCFRVTAFSVNASGSSPHLKIICS